MGKVLIFRDKQTNRTFLLYIDHHHHPHDQAHMLCRNEERPDNDEQFVAILSSVSFIMLKKGDYVKAKAFAEQVEPLFRLLTKLKTYNPS